MDPFTLEATVHRIGGNDYPDRAFGPWSLRIIPGSQSRETLQGRTKAYDAVTLQFARWVTIRPGLLGGELALSTVNGQLIGPPRAILVSLLPSDVPIYSAHISNDPDLGVYSVGLRLPRSAWAPEDLGLMAEATGAPVG